MNDLFSRQKLIAIGILVVFLGLVASFFVFTGLSPEIRERFGDELIALLQTAERVESYQITANPAASGEPFGDTGLKILRTGQPLSNSQIKEFASILLGDSSYKDAEPRALIEKSPEFGFIVYGEKDHADFIYAPNTHSWIFSSTAKHGTLEFGPIGAERIKKFSAPLF